MCEFNQIPDLYNKIADLEVQIETARQKVVTMAGDIDFQSDINDAMLESEKQVQEQIKAVDQKVVGLAFEMASQQGGMADLESIVQGMGKAHLNGLIDMLNLLVKAMPEDAE